jgi:hypothetical protein
VFLEGGGRGSDFRGAVGEDYPGEVLELYFVAKYVGEVRLMGRRGGSGVEEDVVSCERGEVVGFEVDSSTG